MDFEDNATQRDPAVGEADASAMTFIADALTIDTAAWGGHSREASVASSTGRGARGHNASAVSSVMEETDDSGSDRYGTNRPGPKSKKGRGRPATTGASHRLQESRAKRQAELDLRREIDIDDPAVLPSQPLRPKGHFEEDLVREFHADTALELASRASEQANRAEKTIKCVSNIKGTDVKRLRECIRTMGAFVTILVGRVESAAEESIAAHERDDLWREIRSLKLENERLRAEVKASLVRETEARERADRTLIEAIRSASLGRLPEPRVEDGMTTGVGGRRGRGLATAPSPVRDWLCGG